MPDITMCTNKDCVYSLVCERFMAIPNKLQSYQRFEPKLNEQKKIDCDFYIPIYKSE